MNREKAEGIIAEYMKPVFGFALKRCKNVHDAEDLSQEIILRAYRALLLRDDIEDAGRFVWTIARNALANYYRDTAKYTVVLSPDVADDGASPFDLLSDAEEKKTLNRLRDEIAYLSKVQRRIVTLYYFENKMLGEIATELDLPVGTVKWHLFEAKKELKRGMEKVREAGELKYNPIKLVDIGINGTIGKSAPRPHLRSTLSQNICYDVRDRAKTVGEIADDLGVSPVFIESEVEELEDYGLLVKKKDKYLVNFLLSDYTDDFLLFECETYRRAATDFANELFDELTSSGILDDPAILCGQNVGSPGKAPAPRDRNFLLWTLIPFISDGGVHLNKIRDCRIRFDEVATIRPDGGVNIFHATLDRPRSLPANYVEMNQWVGPMFFGRDRYALWMIDTEWSDARFTGDGVMAEKMTRVLCDYAAETSGKVLPKDEYVWLAENGFVRTAGEYDGDFQPTWQTVSFANAAIREKLLSIGKRLREKHRTEWDELRGNYVREVLKTIPAHLSRVKEFELQFLFNSVVSDPLFCLHCIRALLDNGKLQPPAEEQKKTLTVLIFPQ